MNDEKAAYRKMTDAFCASPPESLGSIATRFLQPDCHWYGSAPIDHVRDAEAIAERIWMPMKRAFQGLERRDEILIGGESGGHRWVAATGHYAGEFREAWLGIPPSGQPAKLRFGEFVRFEHGRACEFRTLFDLVALARGSGIGLLPDDAGSSDPVPGPATGDGVITNHGDRERAAASLALVESMIGGLLEFDGVNLDSMGMERFWTDDMRWYGPGGIGTTYGLDGFQRAHQGPFLNAFPDRTAPGQTATLAEGAFVAVTGWPSVVGTHLGSYLGIPATGHRVEMRVMDFWRAADGRLAENWVLIDMIDLFRQLGVDLLAKLPNRHETDRRSEP
ncbi:MAG: ester cyclase [Planctomycetes bacterium]|nr:ester cyclase [Planctomycetota bacterium]